MRGVYGRIVRQLRIESGRSQAEVARSVGMSPAKLARLESDQRGLSVEDFVAIAEALGAKPGNLLPNDIGDIGHLKQIVDRLATVQPEFLSAVTTIITRVVQLTHEVATALPRATRSTQAGNTKSPAAKPRSRRR
jgi:transcriptional regulator with XRE-family HTH domain